MQTFSTADILTCHEVETTSLINSITDGTVPFKLFQSAGTSNTKTTEINVAFVTSYT